MLSFKQVDLSHGHGVVICYSLVLLNTTALGYSCFLSFHLLDLKLVGSPAEFTLICVTREYLYCEWLVMFSSGGYLCHKSLFGSQKAGCEQWLKSATSWAINNSRSSGNMKLDPFVSDYNLCRLYNPL